jgi:hypothetical protein
MQMAQVLFDIVLVAMSATIASRALARYSSFVLRAASKRGLRPEETIPGKGVGDEDMHYRPREWPKGAPRHFSASKLHHPQIGDIRTIGRSHKYY